jgi:hypothetical protein
MDVLIRHVWRSSSLVTCGLAACATLAALQADLKPEKSTWNVDDVRAGMRGIGRTAMRGTKVESFDVEILGVLKNTSPGRDLILARLSGLDLEKTGVIAGMSGSPVYVDDKLVGAVAYAWSFGKEPIAGITPFTQMRGYAAAVDGRVENDNKSKSTRIGLHTPIVIDERPFDSVTVAQGVEQSLSSDDSLWLTQLRTPLAATGMTAHALDLFRHRTGNPGWTPVQTGAAGGKILADEATTPLEPGGPLAVALIRGDFDLSGIGTVTHISGKRVYGWGHPFMSLGGCELPLMTGYIHAVYPRQTVSFKIGSPLRTVGTINADVSTGIAGWLDRTPELLPVRMTVSRGPDTETKTFDVEIVRQKSMMATLLYAALTNSVDMEGDLPEELTAELSARIYVDGRPVVMIEDTYSGASYSGGRAPQALYNHISALVHGLVYNSFEALRLNRIECDTVIHPGRRSAEIETVEVKSDLLCPGETLKAVVNVHPYKGAMQRVALELPIPSDMPEGVYTATICDEHAAVRAQLRDNPTLQSPNNLDQLFESIRLQTSARRTTLALRVPTSAAGVAMEGKSLPNLPPSMVSILGASRRTGAQPVGGALVARRPTAWVLQGSESVRFAVVKNKKVTE